MRATLITINVLAIAAATALLGLDLVYGPVGALRASNAAVAAVLLLPCFATIAGLRAGEPSIWRRVGIWSSAIWASMLLLVGIGASTGIGGALGLLVVIIPAILLLVLNWFALARCKSSTVDA